MFIEWLRLLLLKKTRNSILNSIIISSTAHPNFSHTAYISVCRNMGHRKVSTHTRPDLSSTLTILPRRPSNLYVLKRDVSVSGLNLLTPKPAVTGRNSNFTSISDQLRSLLPQTNLDISKLIHFVNSRKDAGITFSIPHLLQRARLSIVSRIYVQTRLAVLRN